MPTYEDALLYLGIDYPDATVEANVKRALATAIRTLKGAVGDDVEQLMPSDERAKELVLVYLDDLYSNRGLMDRTGVSAKVSLSTRRMVCTMELQLQMELRQLREEVGV
jgi:hypothetical protein